MTTSLATQLLELKRTQKDERSIPQSSCASILLKGRAAKNLEIEKLFALVQNAVEELEKDEPLLNEIKFLLF